MLAMLACLKAKVFAEYLINMGGTSLRHIDSSYLNRGRELAS